MLQDRLGFLWVGTRNGVFRYDGRKFVRYGVEEGVPAASVESIHETEDGTIWAGTTAGLVRRPESALESRRFEPVALPDGLDSVEPNGLASDTKGRLFVGTHKGLVVGNPEGVNYHFELLKIPGERTNAAGIHVDPQDRVWLWCGSRICRYDNGIVAPMSRDLEITPNRAASLATDRAGNLWARSALKLFVRRKDAKDFEPFSPNPPASNSFTTLYVDRDGKLLVPTDLGLAALYPNGWRFVSKANGLNSNSTTCAFQDREGSVWIGLGGAGLTRWKGYSQWESWTAEEGLGNDSVRAITKDAKGKLWVGNDVGLFSLTRNDHGETAWKASKLGGPITVDSILPDQDGMLWVGSSSGLFARFNPQDGSMKRFGPKDGLDNDHILHTAFDGSGRLWLSTQEGLFVVPKPGRSATFAQILPPGIEDGATFHRMLLAKSGDFWIAGKGSLLRLSGSTWKQFGPQNGLRKNRIERLTQTPDGTLWIAYQGSGELGRIRIAGDQMTVEHLNPKGQQRPDLSAALATDSQGRLWRTSDDGISFLEGQNWKHYGVSDGLIWDDCNANAFYGDTDGSIWVGTSMGLSHFRMPTVEFPQTLQTLITGFVLGSKEQNALSGVSVPFADHTFEVKFAALTFQNEDSMHFRYRLKGLEENWTETKRGDVRYSSLPGGDYVFEVAAVNGKGVGAKPAAVSFGVHPPWWRSWYFIGACVVALASLAGMLWMWRFRRILEEHGQLELLVQERTEQVVREQQRVLDEKRVIEEKNREIERLLEEARQATQYKSQFVANMSHEIRTPMNGILAMTELLISGDLKPDQKNHLELVRTSAVSLLSVINDILDFSKVEAGRLDLEPIPFQLRTQLSAVVGMFAARAREKGILLKVRIDGKVPDNLVGDAGRLRQVLVNLLSNAVKFTERGEVTAFVSMPPQTSEGVEGNGIVLHFTVRDTGIGIAKDQQAAVLEPFRQGDGSITRKYGGTGLGLTISAQLATLMGGRMWLESEPGAGSNFHFTVRFGLAPSGSAAIPTRSRPLFDPGSKSLRILVAEDNQVNQRVIVSLLEKKGHLVTVTANGKDAVDATERQSFDVVLMDLQMPEMDGFEATAAIRANEVRTGRKLTIVALTASAMVGDREKCLAAGMDDYVSKPIDTVRLYDLLAKIGQAKEPGSASASAAT